MDANKDGTIDAEEWDKFMTPDLKAAIEGKLSDNGLVAGFKPLVDIARVFDQLDTDKSGDLSRDEIKHALEVLGIQERLAQGSSPNHVIQTQREGTDRGYLNKHTHKRLLPLPEENATTHHTLPSCCASLAFCHISFSCTLFKLCPSN